MTYRELDDLYFNSTALYRMMCIVEEQTGKFPDWGDEVPEWILKNFNLI